MDYFLKIENTKKARPSFKSDEVFKLFRGYSRMDKVFVAVCYPSFIESGTFVLLKLQHRTGPDKFSLHQPLELSKLNLSTLCKFQEIYLKKVSTMENFE